jgi:hypothetical protein
MKRLSWKFSPLLVMTMLIFVVSAAMPTIQDGEAGLGPSVPHSILDQQVTSAQSKACSAGALPMAGESGECGLEPLGSCPPSMKCKVVAECPDFHPIGCVWLCQQHCCVLDCS